MDKFKLNVVQWMDMMLMNYCNVPGCFLWIWLKGKISGRGPAAAGDSEARINTFVKKNS